jgi:hypothetical protein
MDLIERLKTRVWEFGVRARHPRRSVRDLVNHQVFEALATEIYDESWDLLVVLDACRPDLMSEAAVESEYDFLSDVGVRYSPGSSSQQWLAANFSSDRAVEMANTAYVTGNPFSDELLDGSDFGTLAEVWKAAWDEEVGTVPPRPITDRAIDVARSADVDRLVVHYMQPHFPSLTDPELGSRVDPETNVWIDPVWDRLADGELSRDRVWNAYRANLERVLDDVALLLENVDAPRTVITADHGNGFGEDGVYGHPRLRVHRSLRAVPWVRTVATDERTHDPRPGHHEKDADDVVQERLRDLGYR